MARAPLYACLMLPAEPHPRPQNTHLASSISRLIENFNRKKGAHLVQQQVRHVALAAGHLGPIPVRHRFDAAHT